MSDYQTFKKTSLSIAVAAATVFSMQSSVVFSEDAMLEEVIVTATARAQSTQDIPFNISAVSGDDIAAQNIVDTADLMRTIPGVTLADRGHRNSGVANSLVIRGMNVDSGANGDVGLNTVATVATYVDNTPIFANFLLKDIERVEVLRGPQGTLYGSGALGGTVRYLMNKPNMDALSGSLKTGVSQSSGSDGSNTNVDGVINIPINDQLAVRVSAGTMDNAGVIDYTNLYQLDDNGIPVVEADNGDCISVSDATTSEVANNGSCYTSKNDADDVDIWYGRASVLFEPSEDLSFQLNYQRQSDKVGGRRATTSGVDGLGNTYNGLVNGATMLENSDREVELVSLDIEADLGFATLTSNTSSYETEAKGWRDNTSIWVTDRGPEALDNWFSLWYPGMPRPVSHVEAGTKEEAIVQEFRLVSNTGEGDKVDWIAGVYYMDQDRETNNFSHMLGLNEYGAAIGAWYGGDWVEHDRDSTLIRKESFTDMAAYGEMTYHLSEKLRVTGGLRWFDNELTNDTALDAYYGHANDLPFVQYPTQSESDVLVKANLSWDMSEETMLYFTYSEGFRRGGPNSIPTSGPFAEFNPETVAQYGKDTVQNYELGIKGSTDTLRYSADIYYVDWKDPQLNTGTAAWNFFMAQNGGSARTQGVELELEAAITSSLNVSLGYAYTDAELSSELIQPQTGNVIAESGQTLPGTPKSVATLGLNHTMDVANGATVVTRVNGYYQSSSTNHITNGVLQDTHEGFSLWNLTSTLYMDEWSVSLYAKNIFDEAGTTGSYPSAYMANDTGTDENYLGNNQRNYITAPRTLGLNVGYEF